MTDFITDEMVEAAAKAMTDAFCELDEDCPAWEEGPEFAREEMRKLVRPALVAAMRAAWRPIESAPKDGTLVDLWMIDQDGDQWRETDAYYVTAREYEIPHWDEHAGSWALRGQIVKRDGWWAPNHDYDGADGWCEELEYYNPHPMHRKTVFKKPVGWQPLPPPPAKEGV
jgi:hypothetical protein